MERRHFIRIASVSSVIPLSGFKLPGNDIINPSPLIKAPSDPVEWENFLNLLKEWREVAKKELNYNDLLYECKDFQWVSSNFNCYFLMMCDLKFYDPEKSNYLVDQFIDETEQKFGKINSLVLWHAYPRIGVDQRNQFDFYRDMPGGLEGIKKVAEKLHSRDIKVFINYNPWDTGTRREPKSDVETLVEIIDAIDADGIFLDTMNNLGDPIRSKLDSVRKGVVLESELDLPVKDIASHHCSWAQWFEDSEVPGILRNKWFESRHMQHQIKRWNHDHSGELQTAWMNGSGMMIWENVFGTWMGWNNRDKSMLRSMSLVQQFFSQLFTSGNWVPMIKTLQPGVYANKWENKDYILYTLINRKNEIVNGKLLQVENKNNYDYFNCISGEQIRPEIENNNAILSETIGNKFVAGFIVAKKEPDRQFLDLLQKIKKIHVKKSMDVQNPVITTKQVKSKSENRTVKREIPDDMVFVPGIEKEMDISFRVRECTQQLPFGESSHFNDFHNDKSVTVNVRINKFAIDKYPVTNGDFGLFLKETGYQPKHTKNFLKHWNDGKIPPGLENHPVIYIGLEDARMFAKWKGKRLPSIHEWTLAAIGENSSMYPWGNELKEGFCILNNKNTTPVNEFPKGVSPFGCYDMIGNTWEWTESEYSDGRTRFCFLKGGSYFQPSGSKWYILGGPKSASWVEKFILMWPGLDRCSTIGFRCAANIKD